MMLRKTIALIILCASPCFAWPRVTIETKDGRKLTGELLKLDSRGASLKQDSDEVVLRGAEIATVNGRTFRADDASVYAILSELIPRNDADAHYQLGLWCKERDMRRQAMEQFGIAARLDPNHADARREMGLHFYRGRWWPEHSLIRMGLVQKDGKWMTEAEAGRSEGKVFYNGTWVPPEDKEYLESRKFGRYTRDGMITHNVADLAKEVYVLTILNEWKLSRAGMKRLYNVLLEAEPIRQGFLEQIEIANREAEKAWLRLREYDMEGVIHSFEQPRSVRLPAVMAEQRILKLRVGCMYKMSTYLDDVFDCLTDRQEQQLYSVYCSSCHSSRRAGSEGGFRKITGSKEAVRFVTRVRTMSGGEYVKRRNDLYEEAKKLRVKPRRLPRRFATSKDAPATDAEDKEDFLKFCDELRKISDEEFQRNKGELAAIVQAPSYEVRVFAKVHYARKQMRDLTHEPRMTAMLVDCFFDGTMLKILRQKLSISDEKTVQPVPVIDEDSFRQGPAAAFNRNCSVCHSRERVLKTSRDRPGWTRTVAGMLYCGGTVRPEYVRAIADYLAEEKAARQE